MPKKSKNSSRNTLRVVLLNWLNWGFEILPYLVVATVIMARDPLPLFRAEFWAEDGTDFFQTAILRGAKSVITPVYGYLFLISRLIAYVATFFPVLWTPTIYAGCCLFFNVLAIGYFARPGFSWLVASRAQRIFVCAILALGPGTAEIFMNLCNLSTSLTFLALLMLLEKPFPPSPRKIWAFFILFISAGQTFLLGFLIFLLWQQIRSSRYFTLLKILAPVTILNIIGNHISGGKTKLLDYGLAERVPRIFLENFVLRFLAAPFLGSDRAEKVMAASALWFWLPFILGMVAIVIILARFWRPTRQKALLLFGAYVCVIATYGVITIARNYAIGQVVRESHWLMWDHRYSFLPGAVSLIIWFSVFFDLVSRPAWLGKGVAMAGVYVLSYNAITHWQNIYVRPDLHWPESAEKISSVFDSKKKSLLIVPASAVRVGVHPYGYRFGGFELVIPSS